jgi:hypothetical protein
MNIFVSHGIADFGGGASSAEYISLRRKVVLISTKRLQPTGLLPSLLGATDAVGAPVKGIARECALPN